MENALLVGLSRQIALRRELDVIANNLANLGTNGFKGESVLFEQYLASPARDDNFPVPDQQVSFVIDRATRTDFSQGTLERTGNQFDVAIDGEGYFAVETAQGERYTRNGSFALSTAGELVTPDGHRVLGASGPIVLDASAADVSIARDGTVSTRNGELGRIRLVRFEGSTELNKIGLHLYSASGGQPLPVEPSTRVVQGAVEKSNVRPIVEIGRMIEVTRAYTTLASIMGRNEELRRSAIERLADVPA